MSSTPGLSKSKLVHPRSRPLGFQIQSDLQISLVRSKDIPQFGRGVVSYSGILINSNIENDYSNFFFIFVP
ncbi:unnamed protein product [Callosobruchus maculatus]|uniref:Uncharacterized protein n=1 Tax=Callosobruchus maculatus TaxID=64391 RepID=A0A653DV45_CALMS|nr:unnamed protein product [Callosobruchus maculatus]